MSYVNYVVELFRENLLAFFLGFGLIIALYLRVSSRARKDALKARVRLLFCFSALVRCCCFCFCCVCGG